MNQLYLTCFLLNFSWLLAQSERVIISGQVKSDKNNIENIHILNNNTKKGSISNKNGKFNIAVKLNDTLTISGIQFYTLEIKITEKIIEDKYLVISLLQKINTLAEVKIKSHNLFGNLTLDAKNFMDTIKKINPAIANINSYDLSIPSKFMAKQLDEDRLDNPTDPMAPIGGDIIGLAYFILKPAINELKKINKTKRENKQKERKYIIQTKTAPEKIRSEFGDDFFIKTLRIPVNKIDAFILYCKPKGIINLYLKNNKIQLIDVFLSESKKFNINDEVH